MRFKREIFGESVRDEVRRWMNFLLDQTDDIKEIRLSGAGIKNQRGESISDEGFRLKHSEIHYLKKTMMNHSKTKWESETKIEEGDRENFGKVVVLTRIKKK